MVLDPAVETATLPFEGVLFENERMDQKEKIHS